MTIFRDYRFPTPLVLRSPSPSLCLITAQATRASRSWWRLSRRTSTSDLAALSRTSSWRTPSSSSPPPTGTSEGEGLIKRHIFYFVPTNYYHFQRNLHLGAAQDPQVLKRDESFLQCQMTSFLLVKIFLLVWSIFEVPHSFWLWEQVVNPPLGSTRTWMAWPLSLEVKADQI